MSQKGGDDGTVLYSTAHTAEEVTEHDCRGQPRRNGQILADEEREHHVDHAHAYAGDADARVSTAGSVSSAAAAPPPRFAVVRAGETTNLLGLADACGAGAGVLHARPRDAAQKRRGCVLVRLQAAVPPVEELARGCAAQGVGEPVAEDAQEGQEAEVGHGRVAGADLVRRQRRQHAGDVLAVEPVAVGGHRYGADLEAVQGRTGFDGVVPGRRRVFGQPRKSAPGSWLVSLARRIFPCVGQIDPWVNRVLECMPASLILSERFRIASLWAPSPSRPCARRSIHRRWCARHVAMKRCLIRL